MKRSSGPPQRIALSTPTNTARPRGQRPHQQTITADQHVKGAISSTEGQTKEDVGKLTGDKELEVMGDAQQLQGKAQEGLGDVEDAVRKVGHDHDGGEPASCDTFDEVSAMKDDDHAKPDLTETTQPADTRRTGGEAPDASGVVEGPIGSASLSGPTGEPMGADLSKLPLVDAPDGGEAPS